MRQFVRIAFVLCAAGCAAACTAIVDSAVESRYAQYNYSTDWAKNEAILLNIIRASEYQPLNFMSFQPYQGTASVSGGVSSPAFIIGPARSNSQKQFTFGQGSLTGSATGSGTISVTTLDTEGFYAALLTPVEFTDLDAFQRQGYSRELLFRLFADYVSIKPSAGNVRVPYSVIVYNDPSPDRSCFPVPPKVVVQLYGHRPRERQTRICFEDLVVFALVSGLSSEVRTAPNPAGSTAKSNGGGSPSPGPTTITEGRICFDPALATRAIYEFESKGLGDKIPRKSDLLATQYHPVCGGTGPLDYWKPSSQLSAAPSPNAASLQKAASDAQTIASRADEAARAAPGDQVLAAAAKKADQAAQAAAAAAKKGSSQSATSAPKPGVATLNTQVPRITGFPVWDIHRLGEYVVEIGTRSTFSMYNFLGRLMNVQGSAANRLIGPLSEDDYDHQILTVVKGQPTGCFVSALFNIGVYCVPIDGAQNTKSTFSILSQLLALKTTTGDLQLLPTIRLLPTE